MRIFNSAIIDFINKCLFCVQSKGEIVKNNSFLLSNPDLFIFLSIAAVYILSAFASNGIIAVFACAAVFLTILKVLTAKGEKFELQSCNFYLIIYLLICFISNFTSSLPEMSFYGFSKTLLYFAFYFALCQFLKNNKHFILPILFIIGGAVTIESITGIIQNHSDVLSLASWQDTSYTNPENIIARAYGTLQPSNPNLFGGWLIAGLPSLICITAVYFSEKKIIPAVIASCAFAVSALCIFYTGCRGAYIALFAVILCVILVLMRLNKFCKISAALITASGGLFILFNKSILYRLMSIFLMRRDSSSSFRMNVYSSALEMFKDNPIFGIGAGNKVFREIYGLYMRSGFDALSCYSVFLETAVESGIFSLIAFLMFLGSILTAAFKKFVSSDNTAEKIILFSAFASILAVMTHGLFDTVYFRPQIQFVFWTMAAIITVLA